MNKHLDTPVLLIIFNRPDTTRRVFEEIKRMKPNRFFIAADGPRNDNASDKINCALARDIIKLIDWPCSVKTLFRDQNLGCRVAVSGAISWFFDQVEEGIILEDDCLPHPDFFTFCEAMLSHYRNDHSVMHISGDNFQFGTKRGDGSYYYSRISHIWGWASWKRAWQHYDVDMKDFPEFRRSKKSFFINRELEKYWIFHFKRMYKGADTWDYQWTYAIMKNGGYCIMPNVNLISNIGFGENATHAFDNKDYVAAMRTSSLGDLIHPAVKKFDDDADRMTLEIFPIPSLLTRVVNKVKRIGRNLIK